MWVNLKRPGYFGRNRDKIIASLNDQWPSGWLLVWIFGQTPYDFLNACVTFYEASYIDYLYKHPMLLEKICSEYHECYDNDITNIVSGLDYNYQESGATHIQDIAVRNAIKFLGKKFEGPKDKLLEIRGKESIGGRLLSPGVVPFIFHTYITEPSLAPKWAYKGSVEDFWQSNKWIQVYKKDLYE